MRAWEIYSHDFGWGEHPVVLISHPERAERKPYVEILDCSSQRSARSPMPHEVVLDEADGLDWPTLCKCDCIFAVHRDDLGKRRGEVSEARRAQIVRTIIQSHGWTSM